MPYNSKSSLIADQQLKVQELCVRFSDLGLYSQSGSTVTVDIGETPLEFVSVQHQDNSGPSCVLNPAASNSISSTSLVMVLANALAANDCLIIKYITHQ